MTRWTSFASVAALFLSGLAIGALGMHVLEEHRESGPVPRFPHQPGAAIDTLQMELGLSPEQRQKVEVILREAWREGEEIRREVRPRLDQHLAETERKLAEVLNPEQRERFEAMHRERRRHAEQILFGPPPPPGSLRRGPHGDQPPPSP